MRRQPEPDRWDASSNEFRYYFNNNRMGKMHRRFTHRRQITQLLLFYITYPIYNYLFGRGKKRKLIWYFLMLCVFFIWLSTILDVEDHQSPCCNLIYIHTYNHIPWVIIVRDNISQMNEKVFWRNKSNTTRMKIFFFH